MTSQLAPGLYPNMPFARYRDEPGISNSDLRLVAVSPLTYWRAKQIPRKPTDSMQRGTAGHVAVLELHRFLSEALPTPEINPDTGKPWRANTKADKRFREDNPDRLIMTRKDFFAAKRMGEAVRRNPRAQELLRHGRAEVSIFWDCPETGVRRKGRCDFLGSGSRDHLGTLSHDSKIAHLVDVKTAATVRPRDFVRDTAKRGAHRQLAGYHEGLRVLGYEVASVSILAVEQAEPHDTIVFPLPWYALEAGAMDNIETLKTLLYCRETGQWPGFAPDGVAEYDMRKYASWLLPPELKGDGPVITMGGKPMFGGDDAR